MRRRGHERVVRAGNIRLGRESNDFDFRRMPVGEQRMGILRLLPVGLRTTMQPVGYVEYLPECQHDLEHAEMGGVVRKRANVYLGGHRIALDHEDVAVMVVVVGDGRGWRGRQRVFMIDAGHAGGRQAVDEPLFAGDVGEIA